MLSPLEAVDASLTERRSLAEHRPHVGHLKRLEAVDLLRPWPLPLRERVHVMQQHSLSRHLLTLLKHLDAVIDGDGALGPQRRDDLDHHAAHLPSLDVFQETLEDHALRTLGVHLDERAIPPVMENGVGEQDTAAASATASAAALLRIYCNFLQALVAQGDVADDLGVAFYDVCFLDQAQVEEVHAARQVRVLPNGKTPSPFKTIFPDLSKREVCFYFRPCARFRARF